MPELFIKDINGDVYGSYTPMHFMVAEEYGIDFESIADCGVRIAGGEILWLDRKPH